MTMKVESYSVCVWEPNEGSELINYRAPLAHALQFGFFKVCLGTFIIEHARLSQLLCAFIDSLKIH